MAHAVIVHQIPGRVRLHVGERRGDAEYFSGLSESFARFPNVQSARVNPATGSVVLEFMGSLRDVMQQAHEDNLLSIIDQGARRVDSPAPSRDNLTASPIHLVSGREINRMFMVGSVLTAAGVIQALRGDWLPPAIALFWYAAEAFRMAERQRK